MHILGIVCGVLGILIVFIFLGQLNARHFLVRFLLALYVFVIAPYIVALAGWYIAYLRDKRLGIKDEKQIADLNKSGMLSLQISILIIIAMTFYGFLKPDPKSLWYNFSGLVPVLWLPFILYVTMIVFSGASLYNFKRN
jgi:cytochrome bd-type quinol oxidase subunit 1